MRQNFNSLAPEPFEDIIHIMGEARKRTNTSVMSIFDKSNGELHLLLQPARGVLGLLNDIDGGIPFRPWLVSDNKKELIMLCSAEEFIEHYTSMDNPPAKVSEILQSIDEESNPVAIIATLK
jgi:hypothetical protein